MWEFTYKIYLQESVEFLDMVNSLLTKTLLIISMCSVLTNDHWALSRKWAQLQVGRDNMLSP